MSASGRSTEATGFASECQFQVHSDLGQSMQRPVGRLSLPNDTMPMPLGFQGSFSARPHCHLPLCQGLSGGFRSRCSEQPDKVRHGSKAPFSARARHFRLSPTSGHSRRPSARLKVPRRHRLIYPITSSARVSTAGGIVRPSAFAVVRLMNSSKLVGCMTGRSSCSSLKTIGF